MNADASAGGNPTKSVRIAGVIDDDKVSDDGEDFDDYAIPQISSKEDGEC